MRIAVFGDIHGHWCDFRDAVLELQSQAPLDLVLQCGDAQPIRNEDDLGYMHRVQRSIGNWVCRSRIWPGIWGSAFQTWGVLLRGARPLHETIIINWLINFLNLLRTSRFTFSIRWLALGVWSLAAGCNSHLPYTASEIASFEAREFGVELTYQTRAGRQNAFYVPPKERPERPPERLVIMYPGIRSLALDWLEMVDHAPDPLTGFLLIDYPGRGKCEGLMRPKHLPEFSFGAIEALGLHLNVLQDELTKHLCLLGHFFGCAAALQFAPHVDVERIVLIAPFTTLHRAVYKLYGPLAWLMPDRMDNRKRLRELRQRPRRPALVIIHGSADDTIPVKMGRDLAGLFPGWIVYHEIEGADHAGILKTSEALIFEALFSQTPSPALPLSPVTDTASPTRMPDGETTF
ncbi:MAG: hypothetical protein KAV83_04935 [Desulfobacterales bacterium]|nr:hypothetical protein [Desulfobacterales bacterium]